MSDLLAEILKAKSPQRQTTHILLNPGLEEEHTSLLMQIARAEKYDELHNERDTAPSLKAKLEEVEEAIAEARQPFVFQSIGRRAWSALLDENKPREDHEDDKEAGFDVDKFPVRLIAVSSYNPKITLDRSQEIWDSDDWSDAETTLLLTAAIVANKEIVDVPFTNDGLPMGTRSTASPSNTVTTEDSLTPSS